MNVLLPCARMVIAKQQTGVRKNQGRGQQHTGRFARHCRHTRTSSLLGSFPPINPRSGTRQSVPARPLAAAGDQ
jgi:hypothetical protein